MAIHVGKQNIPCICVTNRTLCRDDFLTRIDHIAKKGVADAILLREKDLTEREYLELAEKVLSICKAHNRRCILHTYYKVAKELGCKEIHLPLPLLQKMREEGEKEWFTTVGTSVRCHEVPFPGTIRDTNRCTADEDKRKFRIENQDSPSIPSKVLWRARSHGGMPACHPVSSAHPLLLHYLKMLRT